MRFDGRPLYDYIQLILCGIRHIYEKKKRVWVGMGGHIHQPIVAYQILSIIELRETIIPKYNIYLL